MNNEKVVWIRENEAHFIVLCHQECLEGNMLLTNFTSTVYNKICDKLNALMAGRIRTATDAHANSSRHPVCDYEDTGNVGDDDDDVDVTPIPSHTQSDIPSGSHSAYNFLPNTSSGTSQSSGRKRKVGSSERDMVVIQTMLQFGAHI
ncbi:hypothetical protein ACS0TY_014188 [Phlomoides rotata]